MSYLVFARKYRPQSFETVVAQEHVTRTLNNAIDAGKVAHAILFTGPRGTGKTTVARILAKAMNCVEGPTSKPCNVCRSCQEIAGGHAADVFEIDGASNNSVDQVRELRENLKYMPAHSRYKIYIIDEVHMLSLAAFNALLKTLEEPPAHVLFVFATTDPHKIPVTILSRCQRHDLRRIELAAIVEQMRTICDQEGAAIDDAGLAMVAREAGGSMRDALSLLDHVLACAEGPVTAELVAQLLGAAERRQLFELSAAVFSGDLPQVLEKIDGVWRQGLDMKRFYADLMTHFHYLALVQIGDKALRLVDLPGHEIKLMQTQVRETSDTILVQLLDLLFQAEPSVKLSSQPKLALEMVFLKLFQSRPMLPIDTLIERLDQFRSGVPVAPGPRPGASAGPVRSSAREESDLPQDREVPPEPSQPVIPDVPASDAALQTEGRLWDRLLARVSQEKPAVGAFLNKCRSTVADGTQMTLEVGGNEFTFKSIQKNIDYLEAICAELTGQAMKIELMANSQDAAWEYKGIGQDPEFHKEPLTFENVQLTQRSYK